MGLDMYLEARRFVSGWSHTKEEEKAIFDSLVKAINMDGLHDERFATVNVNVAYWRKANHIHNWFVQNVQDGEDDCKQYHVTREKLLELEQLCRDVCQAGTADVASAKLPLATGFFFGSDQYDEYYFEQTDWTAKRIAELMIAIPDDGMLDFYYQSSW
jgi:hypothetical protein